MYWLLGVIALLLVFLRMNAIRQAKKMRNDWRRLCVMTEKGIRFDQNKYYYQCLKCRDFNQCVCDVCHYREWCTACPGTDCIDAFEENFLGKDITTPKVVNIDDYR